MTTQDFPFIISNGPKLKHNAKVRTLIHTKAMANVAATRKKKTTKTKNNGTSSIRTELCLRTSSVSSDEDATHTISYRKSKLHDQKANAAKRRSSPSGSVLMPILDGDSSEQWPVMAARPANSLMLSDYEVLRTVSGIDVRDIAMLTNFNVGRATIITLSKSPNLLFGLFKQHDVDSYLHYIPDFYGRSEPLTTAVDSVLCALRKKTFQEDNPANAYIKHAQAINSLQRAIEDPEKSKGADVMCAAQLLNLREVLEPRNTNAWDGYLHSCITLAKHRTAASYKSDFDKALLMSYAGAVAFDALINDYHCHLAEPEWTEAYRSNIRETKHLTERSSLAINLRCTAFKIPGLWADVTQAIEGDDLFDDDKLAALAKRALDIKAEVVDWLGDYNKHCENTPLDDLPMMEVDMRREISGMATECMACLLRLLATLCDDERLTYEQEAQDMAMHILRMQKQHMPEYGWLFSGREVGIARTIQFTRYEWDIKEYYSCDLDRRMAVRNRYQNWSRYRCDKKFKWASAMALL